MPVTPTIQPAPNPQTIIVSSAPSHTMRDFICRLSPSNNENLQDRVIFSNKFLYTAAVHFPPRKGRALLFQCCWRTESKKSRMPGRCATKGRVLLPWSFAFWYGAKIQQGVLVARGQNIKTKIFQSSN